MIILRNRTPGKLTNNKSLYARHRSNWKGFTRQLETEVFRLRSEHRPIFVEYKGTWAGLHHRLQQEAPHEEDYDDLRRMNETKGQFGRMPLGLPIPRGWRGYLQQDLTNDLGLIWGDFCQISFYRRPFGETYNNLLLVVAISTTNIDIIFSKRGYDKFEHFYHWQALSQQPPLLLDPEDVRTNGTPGFTMINR
jgi:hypothetical protein